jgi:hypothetical protein
LQRRFPDTVTARDSDPDGIDWRLAVKALSLDLPADILERLALPGIRPGLILEWPRLAPRKEIADEPERIIVVFACEIGEFFVCFRFSRAGCNHCCAALNE